MKKKIKRKKYAVGTKVNNYIETPNQALSEHNKNMDISMATAESNPLYGMMQMLGQAGMSAGMQGIAGGMKPGMGKDLVGGLGNILPGLVPMLAMGGQVPNVPVEIEGSEVGQLPTGEVFEAKGPSHEGGGIDVNLPEGTEMYSKRVKIDGVSMADRKKKRARKELTLEQLLDKSKNDSILKSTLKRTKSVNSKEDEADNKMQEFIKAQMGGTQQPRQQYAWGDTIKDPNDPPFGRYNPLMGYNPFGHNLLDGPNYFSMKGPSQKTLPKGTGKKIVSTKDKTNSNLPLVDKLPVGMPNWEIGQDSQNAVNRASFNKNFIDSLSKGSDFDIDSITEMKEEEDMSNEDSKIAGMNTQTGMGKFLSGLGDTNMGDVLGMMGSTYSTFAPMQNTKNMRAGDTPNINPYANFGNEALATNDRMQGNLNIGRDEALKQIQRGSAAQSRTGRGSARGIAQMRAMDLVNNMQNKQASSGIEMNYANALNNLLSQRAGLQNQQDQMQMQGENMRDQNDRADRDAFYSQFSKDIAGKGAGLQALGKNLNAQKSNKNTMAMIEKMKLAGFSTAEAQAYAEYQNSLADLNPNKKKTGR